MSSDHYFSPSPRSDSSTRTIRARLAGRDLDVVTAGGVFSPEHLDQGTRVLLDEVPAPPARGTCSTSAPGGARSRSASRCSRRMPRCGPSTSTNVRSTSCDATAPGSASHNVNAVLPADVPGDVRFATIWSNPPIRVGKQELHAMLEHWLPRLDDDATAWLVVAKHLGAESLQRWIADALGLDVERAANSKGFRVLRSAER